MTTIYTAPSSAHPDKDKLFGVLAEFDSPQALVDAAAEVRKAGYKRWDCYTPFPIHGLDRVMAIPKSILPMVVGGAAASGALGALALAWFCNAYDYPMIFSGKPYWGLPAHTAVAFPALVLSGVVTSFMCVWVFCGLPRFHHPLFEMPQFRRVTDNGFFLAIEATDPCFSPVNTAELLKGLGAVDVELVKD